MALLHRKIGKRVNVSMSLRVFLLSVIIFVIAIGWTMFYVIDSLNNVESYIHSAHTTRVIDQNIADQKVNQLGCYILANTPDNPKLPLIQKARKQYHCPGYGQDPNFVDPRKAVIVAPKSHASGTTGGPAGSVSSSRPTPTGSPLTMPSGTPSTRPPRPTPRPGTSSGSTSLPPVIAVKQKTCSVSIAGICLIK